ncbi:MAG TPA: RagB/SusD family nutrient uptake outer membrane protein [Leeuwenhoekiella sp.]|nr:RagB/SusD family nutrient uptake outer membrane protein [Leeuwenhoekiella sp.]
MNKTINIIFALSFMSLFFVACNDDLLEEEPKSFLSPGTTYNTDAGLAAGGVGLFDEISSVYFNYALMRDYMALANGGTDFMRNGIEPEPSAGEAVALTNSYSPSFSDNVLTDLWSHYYRLANNATTILESSTAHEWENQSLQETTEGEAYFFRGWAHLWLTMLWGDVPSVRESVNGVKTDFVQEPQADVIQYAIEDFQAAVSFLPEEISEQGRLDKAAANHMLAYAYLCAKDYPSAEAAAQSAVDSPNHSLVTQRFGSKVDKSNGNPFWDLFQLDNHNNNPEGLWVLQNGNGDVTPAYTPAENGGPAVRFVRIFQSRIELVSGLKAGPEYGGRGFTRFAPTMPYFEIFEPNDQRGQMPNLQKRFIAIEEGNINNQPVNLGDLIFDFDNPQAGIITDRTDMRLRPYPTKWLKENDPNDSTKYNSNEVGYTGGTIRDHYILRLAETYLILAEAQYMQGNQAEAAANINLIRERSGASPISAGDVTIDFILDEKARELWGEQYSRKVDLFRTGKYIERVQKYNSEAGSNVKEKHTLLPIPQSEIDLNSGNELQQNPGW